jgi:hypothetical protein
MGPVRQQTPVMDAFLEALATQQGGFFSRADALQAGYADRTLARAARMGLVRRVRQGAYSPSTIFDSQDDVGRHRILARATLARQQGLVALTGVSAAAVHGLSVYGHDLKTVQLVRLDGGASRREVNARHHVLNDIEGDVELVGGLLVTNLARTVWEVAAHAGLEAGVATADSAVHRVPDLVDQLAQLQSALGRRPGSSRARMALRLVDGRSQSPGESFSRVIFHRHRVPMPEPQYEVISASGRSLGFADFGWKEDRHLGEFDGKIKYEELLKPGQSASDVVFKEKCREDQIRAELFGMTRWTFVDLRPSALNRFIRRLNADRERSRRLYTRNRVIVA